MVEYDLKMVEYVRHLISIAGRPHTPSYNDCKGRNKHRKRQRDPTPGANTILQVYIQVRTRRQKQQVQDQPLLRPGRQASNATTEDMEVTRFLSNIYHIGSE